MKSAFVASITSLIFLFRLSVAQEPGQDTARMQALFKEAQDLQSTQPQAVLEKLSPLLDQLRQLQQKGLLSAEASKIFQDALLLQVRTQVKLLAPDSDADDTFRELLVLNPKIDDSAFNPREKLLLDKMRSAETGRFSLETNPPGTTLIYLGMELGTTPASVPLIAGTYHLRIRKPGYLDQDFDVVVKASEILSMTRSMRPRAVEAPLTINAAGATVVLGGKALGASLPYQAWIASLPAEQQREYESIIRAWNVDPASASFFLLSEVSVGEPLTLELRAPCYEPLTVKLQISEQEVDWEHPRVLRPELRHIELKKDTGFVEVTSVPAGAEVWIDGALQGKTPLPADVCAGTHRVQVIHRAGQYVDEVVVRRGQVSKVIGELKPALAFLGAYAQPAEGDSLSPLASESAVIARKLVLESTAFSDPQLSTDEIAELRKKGSLPVERLLQQPGSDTLVREIAAASERADMFLFALRTGNQYTFRLYSTMHPIPDIIMVPSLDNASLDFLVSQLNRAEEVRVRLRTPDIGLALLDSAAGLTVLKIDSEAASKTALKPGAVIKSVDQKPMTFRELQQYLQTKKPGQSVSLEVVISKTSTSTVPLPVSVVGAEYPWSTPGGFSNSVLTMMHSIIERDPPSEEAKYAGLSLARGLMQQGEWKLALQFLGTADLESHDSGVGAGTVLFYQGRCYEELGDRSQAESCYTRAKAYLNATLGTPDGPSVSILAERRIQSLKKTIR